MQIDDLVEHDITSPRNGKTMKTILQYKFTGSEKFQLDANLWPCGVRLNIAQKWKNNENQITIQVHRVLRNFSLMQIDVLVVYDITSSRNGKTMKTRLQYYCEPINYWTGKYYSELIHPPVISQDLPFSKKWKNSPVALQYLPFFWIKRNIQHFREK